MAGVASVSVVFFLVALSSNFMLPAHGLPSPAYIEAVEIAIDITNALQAAGLTSFCSTLVTSNVAKGYVGYFTSPSATLTLLAPTNSAMKYLFSLHLSTQQLADILRYHHLEAHLPSPALAKFTSRRPINTFLPNEPVLFVTSSKGGGFASPRNVQNSLASVVIKDVLLQKRVVIHAINKVLSY
eukprot:TRINITY_DN678_c3_g1_i1.p1 TRINITY_DN678_c3_g1~~TRINITY_DN678_c3_g1_i1.p1  ORF type:complete len:184 (+),score=8.16 TRINITY_DN678_c3_g1_i1:134-685(+)